MDSRQRGILERELIMYDAMVMILAIIFAKTRRLYTMKTEPCENHGQWLKAV